MTAQHRAGSGEPLVLIHGYSNTWRVWKPVLPALAERHDVLAVTLAGHHEGNPLEEGVEATVDALADAIERQMDEAGFETAHLAGNSLGGWLALELARRGRSRSVVCLSPAGGWKPGSREERRVRVRFTLAQRLTGFIEPHVQDLLRRPGFRRLLFREVMVHPERISPAEAVYRLRAQLGCTVYWELMEAILREGPPSWFEEIEAPVLVAWAEFDRILPERGYSEGFRTIADVEWTILPGVGHVPMLDDPDLVVRTITEFAARHSKAVSEAAATAAGP